MLKKLLPLTLAATFSLAAVADEASVKKAVEAKLGAKVSSVLKSPYLGLYEVYAEGQILYTDEKLTAIIAGTLIDGKTMKNVTAERMQKLTAIKFSDLPLELAVKQVRGDGRRVMASFEDPNCGYCKKLAKDITKLDNVTIYTFLYPILSPDSLEKIEPDLVLARQGARLERLDDGRQTVGPRRLRYQRGSQNGRPRPPAGDYRNADAVLCRRRARPRRRSAVADREEAGAGVGQVGSLEAKRDGRFGRPCRSHKDSCGFRGTLLQDHRWTRLASRCPIHPFTVLMSRSGSVESPRPRRRGRAVATSSAAPPARWSASAAATAAVIPASGFASARI